MQNMGVDASLGLLYTEILQVMSYELKTLDSVSTMHIPKYNLQYMHTAFSKRID